MTESKTQLRNAELKIKSDNIESVIKYKTMLQQSPISSHKQAQDTLSRNASPVVAMTNVMPRRWLLAWHAVF